MSAERDTTPSVPVPPPPADRPRPPARRAPSPLAVITAALGLFLVVLTILAIQVRRGADPSLGPAPSTPTARSGQGASKSSPAKVVSRSS